MSSVNIGSLTACDRVALDSFVSNRLPSKKSEIIQMFVEYVVDLGF